MTIRQRIVWSTRAAICAVFVGWSCWAVDLDDVTADNIQAGKSP